MNKEEGELQRDKNWRRRRKKKNKIAWIKKEKVEHKFVGLSRMIHFQLKDPDIFFIFTDSGLHIHDCFVQFLLYNLIHPVKFIYALFGSAHYAIIFWKESSTFFVIIYTLTDQGFFKWSTLTNLF